jgi:hypothetical protein
LRKLVEGVVADGLLALGHGAESAVDGFVAQPPGGRAGVPGGEEMLAEGSEFRVDLTCGVGEDIA